MTNRIVDVILKGGERRKAYYCPEKPGTISIAKIPLRADDSMLDGAVIICKDEETVALLRAQGFAIGASGKDDVFTVRVDSWMADWIRAYARENQKRAAAVIRDAMTYWIEHGCPEPKKK